MIVLSGKYQGYMKAVKEKLDPSRVQVFEKDAAAYAKKVIANFKDFEFVRILPVTYDES